MSLTMCFDIASNSGLYLLRSVLGADCGSSTMQSVGYLLLSKGGGGWDYRSMGYMQGG